MWKQSVWCVGGGELGASEPPQTGAAWSFLLHSTWMWGYVRIPLLQHLNSVSWCKWVESGKPSNWIYCINLHAVLDGETHRRSLSEVIIDSNWQTASFSSRWNGVSSLPSNFLRLLLERSLAESLFSVLHNHVTLKSTELGKSFIVLFCYVVIPWAVCWVDLHGLISIVALPWSC